MGSFTSHFALAESDLQFQLGEEVSIYSEKAYRKKQGTLFEAIGNVIIISGQDTLYGERASFDIKKGSVEIEGNVRYITKDVTVYGSKIDYNTVSGQLGLENARIITNEFSIISEKLSKISQNQYEALEAEFTTCRDCEESWSIYGKKISIHLGEYVYVNHAMAKIKGVDVIYIPYIVLPIKDNRESGLLFPKFFSRNNEGFSIAQPVFWAINDSQDATFTPMFLGERGYGLDLQYRQVFGEKKWLELNNRSVNDFIYKPGKLDNSESGDQFYRNIIDLETHYQKSNDTSFHFKLMDSKDTDVLNDFTDYTDPLLMGSDFGAEGFFNLRSDLWSFALESGYRKNLFYSDPIKEDKTYVQVLPSVSASLMPVSLIQNSFGIKSLAFGFDSDFTIFKQQQRDEDVYLRNAARLNAKPYLNWQILTMGPYSLKTNYLLDFQEYSFSDKEEEKFQKYAGVLTTEFSFVLDKIYGLSYRRKINPTNLSQEEADLLYKKNGRKENTESQVDTNLIGKIPSFEDTLTQDEIFIEKNSYRHSQEFKFLHYFITSSKTSGNERFNVQIQNEDGWFDYNDAVVKDLSEVGSNLTRTEISKVNTFEIQWNNSLVKKTPKVFNQFEDEKYLRDNFDYAKIAYFNLSQGFLLHDKEDGSNKFSDKLTRLFTDTGYNSDTWSVRFKDYYFHQGSDHILDLSLQKNFEVFNLLANYNYNSFPGSDLQVLKAGFQVRPFDVFGFSMVKEQDLAAKENIRTVYQADLMPNNNCWILNLNYRDSIVDKRFAFNFIFNFGSEDFSQYRSDYFSFNRLNQ